MGMSKVAEKMRGDKEARETRMDDARRLREREAELAHVPQMEYNSPITRLGQLAPPGWTYAFKRAYIGERYDVSNWMAMEEEGWEMVSVSEHPKLRLAKGMAGNETFQDCFFYKGTVLCKIPTSILNKRKNSINKKNYEEMENLNAVKIAQGMNPIAMKAGHFMQQTKWGSSDAAYEQAFDSSVTE